MDDDNKCYYVSANELFINPRYTSIREDVRAQIRKEKEKEEPIPLCATHVGQQAFLWAELGHKIFGAEGRD
ncbi:hypothetical protein J4217_01860 [Candidatus Pacearchaeota archaeon]|nr:hypothetical protein [Candidatus Pacearchaeota archaeon]